MFRIILAISLCSICLSTFAKNDLAIFAGGCFWCMESPFDKLDGVISSTSGYTGGHTENPTYETSSTGTTGHYEAVQIEYDATTVSYEELLDVYWKNIDPFDAYGQFCDKGPHYRAAIFIMNSEEKRLAFKSRATLQDKLKNRVVTEILSAKQFYPAEDYHQNYYKKNPIRYKYYRYGCNRDKRLNQIEELINSK
ncbi:peptide-methionine (S)-S-oxide reductase MsrA [Gammaproteobacteria bacterium]|jgi:peptide-methionine (S)-S-oxide reductase|nr:peptide-methionine (S)-S-oxide reductase MsrA [Gammaproteobacteria bacterium]|tara:strand:- start:149 stop:733 length:585 start_codon:yes stop_codon:yes gene_type:complete